MFKTARITVLNTGGLHAMHYHCHGEQDGIYMSGPQPQCIYGASEAQERDAFTQVEVLKVR